MPTLVSPGVSVSVTDESFTLGSGQGTVPFILLCTQENKPVASTDSEQEIAEGTLSANANQLYVISSQRELLQTYGTPMFYSEGGAQLNGYSANEYGLLAAYSYLGISNRVFTMRADIDTYQLQPSANPLMTVETGVLSDIPLYWLDMMSTDLALHEYYSGEWSAVENVLYFDSENDKDLNTPTSEGLYAVVRDNNALKIYVSIFSTIYEWVMVDSSSGRDFQYTFNSAPALRSTDDPLVDHDVYIDIGSLGIKVVLGEYDSEQYAYNIIPSPVLDTDMSANAYYGSQVTDGDAYVKYTPLEARFDIMVMQSGTWTPIVGDDIQTTLDGLAPNFVRSTQLPEGMVPVADTYWYNPDPTLVDIMVSGVIPDNTGDGVDDVVWQEYTGQMYVQPDDPVKIMYQYPAVDDLWLDTNDLENYPCIYRYTAEEKWLKLDNANSSHIIFADARYSPTDSDGAPVSVDADAPNPALYDDGTLLFNTRYSGRNVKQWQEDYTVDGVLIGDRWVSVSGLDTDGSLVSGDAASKAVIVKAMKDAVADSDELRAEGIFYNLLAAPGFPELNSDLINLNVDRKEQGFIVGDAPFTLRATGTDILSWATNADGAAMDGDKGLISTNPYLGIYYPSGYATNLDGNSVVVPASHIALRTLAYNDQVAYQWFAPAGLQRGIVTNANSVGYVDDEGEFVSVNVSQGIRDVLYTNNINPIAVIPNRGLHVWGQKTRNASSSALDRINVARLINHIRYQSETAVYPYIFEPNDDLTRTNVKDTIETLLSELVTLRGVDDYLVVCDDSNNTPARIDRNELWVDIAIVPLKSVEFIYIPIRILNTGEI